MVRRHPAVGDAEDARRALCRVEQAAGAGRLDRESVAEVVAQLESGGRALAGVLRRLVSDLELDDHSAETPHLRSAGERARLLAEALRDVRAALEERTPV